MIKRIAKRGVGLMLAVIMTAGILLPSCSKKKPQEIVAPPPIPGAPTLSSPPNRSTKEALNPIFRWMSDGYQSYFILQISNDSTFMFSTVTETLTTLAYFCVSLDKSTTYYWRVKAANIYGSSNWSNVQNFTTGPIELLAALKTPGFARAIAVQGSYAYLISDSSLHVIDINNPTSPSHVSSYNFNFFLGYDPKVKVNGSYAYLATDTGLLIVNIASSTSPYLAGKYSRFGAKDLAVSGNHAFLSFDREMHIIDASNQSAPVLVGAWYLFDSTCYFKGPCNVNGGIAAAGNYAYLVNFIRLEVIDVSNPSSPILTGSLNGDYHSSDLAISGNYLYLSKGSIINITNPVAPKSEGTYGSTGWVGLSAEGNFAHWITYPAYIDTSSPNVERMVITDITNPILPTLIGRFNTPTGGYYPSGLGVAGVNDLIYVGAGNNGLKILKIAP